MILQLSQVMDLGPSLRGATSVATPESVFELTVQRLKQMRLAAHIPEHPDLMALLAKPYEVIEGLNDCEIACACQRLNDNRLERWSLCVQHPDGMDSRIHRQMQVHCRSRDAGGVTVGFRLLFSNPYGVYLASEPPIAPPVLISVILDQWMGSRTGIKLSKRFLHLREHARLGSSIADRARDFPFLVAGPRMFLSDTPISLDPEFDRVRRHLGGLVSFVGLPTSQAVWSFNQKVDPQLEFAESMDVALIWPIPPKSEKADIVRSHHQFSLSEFQSPASLADHLFKLVAERGTFLDPGAIQSIDSVRALVESSTVNALHVQAVQAQEMEHLAISENTRLHVDLQEARKRVVELEASERELKASIYHERARWAAQSKPIGGEEGGAPWSVFDGWHTASTAEALSLFANSRFVTEEQAPVVLSQESHDGARVNRFPTPSRVLQILLFCATRYIKEVRGGASGPQLERVAEECGFVYAHQESAATLGDSRLKAIRLVQHDGSQHLCAAHFKYGKGRDEKCLRVYVGVLGVGAEARVLVGHVGGHLETASSGD